MRECSTYLDVDRGGILAEVLHDDSTPINYVLGAAMRGQK